MSDGQILHPLPTGEGKIIKRYKWGFTVSFQDEKKPVEIRYSDTLHEDAIFASKNLHDLTTIEGGGS